jgi:hypothetical protein
VAKLLALYMGCIRSGLSLISMLLVLSGCGTFAPSLQEFGDEALLVQSIVTSIHCDVADAVKAVIDKDSYGDLRRLGPVEREWYRHWGAEIALTLALDDTSTLSPNAVGMPPSPASSIFTIGGNASISSEATRTDKVNYFFTMKQLYNRAPCRTGLQPRSGAPSIIIQNDLKTRAWLNDQLLPYQTREANLETSAKGVLQQNVLSHEMKFIVTTSGGINPAWTLTRATINQSGTFFSTSRGRTSDLIVTFGPLDPTQPNGGLITQAEVAHQTSQIGLANSINGTVNNHNLSFSIFH